MSGGHLLLSQLDPAQDVVAAPEQLAGYCEGGPSRAGAAVGHRPEVAVRAVVATAVLGCLDRRPAEQGRALFGQLAAAAALARLLDDRVQPGQAHQLTGATKAQSAADLRQQMAGDDWADTEERHQRLATGILLSEVTQLILQWLELSLQGLDQEQVGAHLNAGPRPSDARQPPIGVPF